MDNQKLAKEVLTSVGGPENIHSVVHCATRLRFSLNEEEKADTAALKANPGVIQVVQSGGQYQVVIGSHVNDVYSELVAIADLDQSEDKQGTPEKKNIFNQFIAMISAIFTPFLGTMAGVGVLKGFMTLAVTMGWLSDQAGAYKILFAAADGFFYFLPIFLGFTAARHFKTNEFTAVALATALVYPVITTMAGAGESLDFFGIPAILGQTGYTSSVIPIILAVFIQSKLEKVIKKIVPDFLQIICVPLLLVTIMVPLTFVAIGPLGTIAGDFLGQGYNAIYSFSPIVAGLVMGGLWQVFVMFGMHWGFVPIMMISLNGPLGFDTMAPMLLPAIIAQAGAALGVFFRTKDAKLKSLSLSSVVTAIFGITEPTVYGITLPLKKPFFAACIGGAIGGAIVGFAQVKNFAFGLISVLSIPGFISTKEGVSSNLSMLFLALAVSFVLAMVLTLVLGFEDPAVAESSVKGMNEQGTSDNLLLSPLTGNVVKLADVPDSVFASGALGKGIAVEPTIGELYAPADGDITTLFPTGHAVGLTTKEGVELLMHIGMDTVEMEGNGFKVSVKQGDQVRTGDLLVTFDIDKIKEAGKPIITPIVVTNSNEYLDVLDFDQSEVVTGEEILTIVKQK